MKAELHNSAASALEVQPFFGEPTEETSSSVQQPARGFISLVKLYESIIRLLFQNIKDLEAKNKELTDELKNAKKNAKVEPEKTPDNSSISPSKRRYPEKKKPVDKNGEPVKGKPGPKKGASKSNHRKKGYTRNKKTGEVSFDPLVVGIPTEEVEIRPESTDCPCCGSEMTPDPKKDHHAEQIEIVESPFRRTLYTFNAYFCPDCGTVHYGQAPATLTIGLLGPRLIAMMAFLKVGLHASFTGIKTFLSIFGLHVCRGYISKNLDKCSAALKKSHDEVKEALSSQTVLNIDETGHKENGEKRWTWLLRSKTFSFFAITFSRGSCILEELLGKAFKGIINCDYWGAYRKFLRLNENIKAQFCFAHLKRDVQFLVDHKNNPELSNYGQAIMDIMKELFEKNKLWRRLRGPRAPDDPEDPDLEGEARETKALEILDELREIGRRLKDVVLAPPDEKKAKNLANRFLTWPDYYFTFLTETGVELGVECTNNAAEQKIRTVVLDRHVTQGTRSQKGNVRSERLWTVVGTCAMQGRAPFKFIYESILAHFCKDREYPSLMENKKD